MYYEIIAKNDRTKKADALRVMASYYKGGGLYDVYGRYSLKKATAEYKIKAEMQELKGFNYYITSYNTNMFCCRFETSEAIYYFTPSHNYKIEL